MRETKTKLESKISEKERSRDEKRSADEVLK
jgi:hypothetical protein